MHELNEKFNNHKKMRNLTKTKSINNKKQTETLELKDSMTKDLH